MLAAMAQPVAAHLVAHLRAARDHMDRHFPQEPAERPYGVEAVMRDVSGVWLVLVEPRTFSAES
jgi:hypothetical protein